MGFSGEGEAGAAETEPGCPALDRRHVAALLQASEEVGRKDGEPYEIHVKAGWEEAAQGWGRSSPFACLFQSPKKGKKPNHVDAEYHCLLCVDVVQLSQLHSSDPFDSSAPGLQKPGSSSSSDSPLERPLAPAILHKRSESQPRATSAPNKESYTPEVYDTHYFRLLCKQVKKPSVTDARRPVDTKLCVPGEITALHYTGVRPEQWPSMKKRDREEVLVVNSFAVLPPVKSSGSSKPGCQYSAVRGEFFPSRSETGTGGHGSSDLLEAKERNGVERGEEVTPDTHNMDIQNCQEEEASHTSGPLDPVVWHWQPPIFPGKQFFTSFSIPASKKSDISFTATGHMPSRVMNNTGRNVKQDDSSRLGLSKNGHNHKVYIGLKSKNAIKQSEPELPVLLGTRVRIPASSHRLL
ncbi:uncharacterized protein C16orf46 homolog isoform X1 [Lepisosteus oculatus]|uniref:uncharacterized protein C16orf46 homolog isoform X1 n=1 Tax=Lepisosteus oculatus TaxID=7918 RepID=UPI0035F511B1